MLTLLVASLTAMTPDIARAGPAVDEGLQLLEDWQLEDAFELSQRLLQGGTEDDVSKDPKVWMLAGRVQHHRGEHLSALALLDAAAQGGADTGFAHVLVRNSANYAAHFERLDTANFSIRYLNKDEIVANYAAPVLEAA